MQHVHSSPAEKINIADFSMCTTITSAQSNMNYVLVSYFHNLVWCLVLHLNHMVHAWKVNILKSSGISSYVWSLFFTAAFEQIVFIHDLEPVKYIHYCINDCTRQTA